jgi:hypothetical protein
VIINGDIDAPGKVWFESLRRKKAHEDALPNRWLEASNDLAKIPL